jgi:Spy/CpxP family protein refolding chaperone
MRFTSGDHTEHTALQPKEFEMSKTPAPKLNQTLPEPWTGWTAAAWQRPIWALALLCATIWSPAQSAYAQSAPAAPSAPLAAKPPHPTRDAAHTQQALERKLTELGVSDAQRSQITSIVREASAGAQQRAQRGAALRQQGRSLMTAAQPDRAALEGWHKEVSAHMDQVRRERVSRFLAIRQILTPEQRSQWDAQRKTKREAERKARNEAWAKRRAALHGDALPR